MANNLYSFITSEQPVMEKQAMAILSNLGKLGLSAAGRTASNWLGGGWRNMLGFGLKHISPSAGGNIIDKNTGKLVGYANSEPGHGFRDALGYFYNKTKSFDSWNRRQAHSAMKALDEAVGKRGVGAKVNKGLGYLGTAGVVGGLGEVVAGGLLGEDSAPYKVLHGANMVNPFYHLMMNEYSPLNLAWQYSTPLGLAATGAFKGAEMIGEGMTNAAEQGAQQAITQTADRLGNLSFGERLGMLFSPQSAAQQYRAQAFDALARNMASMRGGDSDDKLKAKAYSDVYNTLG